MILYINEIKNLIPHREPFLFVDSCKIIKEGEHGISKKIFSENEYFFKGHFPQNHPPGPSIAFPWTGSFYHKLYTGWRTDNR